MIRRLNRACVVAACLVLVAFVRVPRFAADTLPAQLTDKEFWDLTTAFSEENGYFQSDNLLSNEVGYQTVIPDLLKQAKQGGVYMGVGPEQNFTYIAALHPKMVFITDIRRGNLHTQLMYKALFELSADRAEFVSRLFSKPRPAGLTAKSTADEIINAYWSPTAKTDDALYKENTKAIEDLLTKKHTLPVPADDIKGIEGVYYNFYWFGPSINYASSGNNGSGMRGNFVDYGTLMIQNDGAGLNRGFLGSEENFQVLKTLESKNLIVPFVGNFAGSKALRAEAKYLKDHQATVTAFYLSNVEQYLNQDGIWNNFCANVAALPLDESSTFIRSLRGGAGGGGGFGGGLGSALGSMLSETKGCAGK